MINLWKEQPQTCSRIIFFLIFYDDSLRTNDPLKLIRQQKINSVKQYMYVIPLIFEIVLKDSRTLTHACSQICESE